MTAWTVQIEPPLTGELGPDIGPTVAVKDLIDVAGCITTCGSAAVALDAVPAAADADCVARVRANGGRIVGKVVLHELAFGGSGVNEWSGTPTNPLDPSLVPGGSSSGSAVAVARGQADVALGTDTGGSIRTPSACCGIVGLKTTFGRLPVTGIHPLAPSLDTVGPMAATVAGVVVGMRLLEAGFEPADGAAQVVGRFRLPGTAPWVDDALDAALRRSELPVEPCPLPGWDEAERAGVTVTFAEAAIVNGALLAERSHLIGADVRERLEIGSRTTAVELAAARAHAAVFRDELDRALERTPVVALPAILDEPPPLSDPTRLNTRRPNVAVNLSGHPAIAVPVPGRDGLPTSLQLIAGHGREDLLVATAAVIEAALATGG